ncbi:hypothetical protein D3C84_1167600 [compost metagenome]
MEWVLVLTVNITEAGQITQAPTMVAGFTSQERCNAAREKISRQLILQSARHAEQKGHPRNLNPPRVLGDCICIEK